MKCAIYQFNPTVGALEENTTKLINAINNAINNGCDIFITSELALCGYIPKDLLFRPDFHEQISLQLNRFLAIHNITLLISAPHMEAKNCYNSVFIIRDGQIIDRYDKQVLPNYDVFDECRYFTPGTNAVVFDHQGIKIGVIICEDTWHKNPSQMARDAGAEILISINASPFNIGKFDERLHITRARVSETKLPLIYVNQLGGQDDVIFDGASFILNGKGEVVARFPVFSHELNYCTLDFSTHGIVVNVNQPPNQENTKLDSTAINDNIEAVHYPDKVESVYRALVLATRDYVTKNGFNGVVLGLSGGIDSALTLAIACDALGSDKILAVMMPSKFTADISITDARDMVKRLNVTYEEIEIEAIFNQFKGQLQSTFTNLSASGLIKKNSIADTTEENLQARSRGVLLMAISNKTGYLVLTTGNKSEMAVGYATLYGDMAGGFAVLKDVPKTLVYQLANWRNKLSEIIPSRIITRAPSAELRENQTDQDSLPDYAVLDAIIELLVEGRCSTAEIINRGFNRDEVAKVSRLIRQNEYKRSQAAVGPKVTKCAFNNDWRYPITNLFQF